MSKTVSQIASELADREAIRECHLSYARAIDRVDTKLLADVFWPNATVDFEGLHKGDIATYLKQIVPGFAAQMEQTAHLMGNNTTIEIDGNRATTESYIAAFHRIFGDEKPFDLLLGGRYLDTLEKRDDIWRILHRKFVCDWFREHTDSADWQQGFVGLHMTPGSRFPDDVSYVRLTGVK